MLHRILPITASAALIAVITACAPAPTTEPSSARPSAAPATPTTTPSAPTPADEAADQVVGTVVRFVSDRTTVDVTIGEDSPGVRDFLTLLPLEVTVEEFAGTEKIAYLSRELNYAGSPGSDPEDGDLIYYTPWGNLGFYYDTTGIGYSDATLHIGTFTATEEQLSLLEGGPVTITIVD